MTSPDYTNDILRIIEILKADTAIYTLPVTEGKLREIYFGEDSAKVHDQGRPYALVTTSNTPFLNRDQLGIGDGSTDPQISVQYAVKVFVKNGKPQKAEELLYDFINKIVTRLKATPRLREPAGLTDPKCIRSFVRIEPDRDTVGKETQSATIVITCQVGDAIELTYGGLTISVLEDINSPHGWSTQNSPDDDGLVDVAPVSLEEKKIFKIESNPVLQESLRTDIRNPAMKPAVITTNGTVRNITLSMLTRVSELVTYDHIPQSVIEIQIIKDTS